MKYRKKPVVIEAMEVRESFEAVAAWSGAQIITASTNPHSVIDSDVVGLDVFTLEGTMRADRGDYIIKGVQGEFYPCKPDIFHATYDSVDAVTPHFGPPE